MKSDDGNTGDAPEAASHPPAANDIEDEVTDAIERSYASRFTTGTDLSPDELKRIKEKQAATTGSSERGSYRR
jgi:hypothetical protein